MNWGGDSKLELTVLNKENRIKEAQLIFLYRSQVVLKHKIIAYIYEVSNKGANLNTIPRAMLFHSFKQTIFFLSPPSPKSFILSTQKEQLD